MRADTRVVGARRRRCERCRVPGALVLCGAGARAGSARPHDRSARVGHAAARDERRDAGGARPPGRRRLAGRRAAEDQAGPRPQ